ncbi:hypothetical protein QTP86_003542 [Hemibagrus guttatus]|nr:hypothetical protein QTP86_003542 [Hemibagrus guttatus]
MSLKLEIEGVMLNVVSGYAPQVGCELEEKERFWSELDEVMESIPTGERVVIGADFNGHVGEGNTGDEEVMGKFGVKERNLEGQMVVDFAKRMDMAVVNTYFQKREEHRVTYKSGDLEKVYDRVPREELWYCMRKSGVAEKYVRVVQDMYERSRTVVRCAVGQTEEFNVEVGLHQGSALSLFLFAMVMDQLSEEVRQESPWAMMFADDIVICSESREQVEENLERWRFALERRGMMVSRSKTEYMCVNEREGSGTVRLQGEEVNKVQEFKYLGSTVQSNGECGKEVKKRVQAGWNGWRKVSGVLCDRKISARIKGKVYKTVVRPAMLYGLETVSLRKRQDSELEVAELKMVWFSLGVTRLDRIRNEYIRGTAHVGRLGDKVREDRLRWFGHVQRRETQWRAAYGLFGVMCFASKADRWNNWEFITKVGLASEHSSVVNAPFFQDIGLGHFANLGENYKQVSSSLPLPEQCDDLSFFPASGGRHSGPAGLHNNLAQVLRRMPFLTQPSHFIRAWDKHRSQWLGFGHWLGIEPGPSAWNLMLLLL